MTGKKKTAASASSVGADGKQPEMKKDIKIITNETRRSNPQAADNRNRKNPEKSGCGLRAIPMMELCDMLCRMSVVDVFLYDDTYLFVGAPKMGKSFFMGGACPMARRMLLWVIPAIGSVCCMADSQPPAGRKTCLQVAFLIGVPVKSAFALLSQKVTKAMRRIRRRLPEQGRKEIN